MKAGSKDLCIAPATKEALGWGLHIVLHAGQGFAPVKLSAEAEFVRANVQKKPHAG